MGRRSKQIPLTGKGSTEFFRYACLHRSKRIAFHGTKSNPQDFEDNEDILHWWRIDLDHYASRYEFIQTAWFQGADQEQLIDIAFRFWNLNDLDCLAYVQNDTGMIANREGEYWKVCDARMDFDPQSVQGKGKMLLLAVIDYRIKAAKRENERAYAGNRG